MRQALWLLLETLGSLLAIACLLRAYMNRVGIGSRNQIGQFILAVTDWLVRPLRRLVPAGGRLDWASIVAALLVSSVLAFLFVSMFGARQVPSFGAVLLVRVDDDTAKLRLLFVEPDARGLGIGARLVGQCTEFARRAGYKRITLWTQSHLAAARKLYLDAGYMRIDESPHRSFGQDLVAETWELALGD